MIFNNIKKSFNLLDKKQKIEVIKLQTLIIINGVLEIFTFGLILPFLYTLVDYERVSKNEYFMKYVSKYELSDNEVIFYFGLIIILFNIFIFFVNTLNNYKITSVSEKILYEFKQRIYKYYLSLEYNNYLKESNHQILNNIINETVRCVVGVILPVLILINKSFTLVLLTILLLIISFKTTLILTLVIGSIYLIINFLLRKKLIETGLQIQGLEEKIFSNLNQPITFFKEIKIFNLENFFLRKYHKLNKSIYDIKIFMNTIAFLPKQVMDIILIILIIGSSYLFFIGGQNMTDYVPLIILYFISASKILPAMNQCFANYSSILNNQSSVNSIRKPLKEDFSLNIKDDLFSVNNANIKDGIFGYKKNLKIFKNLNLNIASKKNIGIVGKSGSGKSTLIDIISNILILENGKLKYNGKLKLKKSKPEISYIPQKTNIFTKSIRDNIVLDKKFNLKKFKKICGICEIDEFVNSLDKGYNTIISENSLSGGQIQRIGIARGIYQGANVLIFDESTNSLDNETEKKILDKIMLNFKDKTIIFSTHKISNLKKFDKIFLLKKGEIIAHGGYNKLFNKFKDFKIIS